MEHVKKDLEPYNCFHPECQKVLRLFPNERQWISHTKTSHSSGSWVCRMPPHATGMKLDTKDAFERHMEIDHAGMYLVSELETLAKGAYLPAPTHQLFPECPMRCLTNDIPQLDELQDSKSLIPHIANHLLLLAVEALPERSVRSSEEFSSEQDEDEGNELDIKKGTSPRKIRTTIRDALESLPTVGSLSYDDWSASSDGGRLSEWGHFACVRQQHSVVDVVDQLQDPAMKSFFMEQHRLSDVSLLRTQILRARRRWRIALTAALFISVLSHKLGKTPRYPSRKGKGKARPLDNQNIEKKVRLWPRILRRSFPKGEVASNDRDFQPLAERLYEKEFEYESTFPPEASGDRLYWPEDVIETLVNEEQVRWELGQAKKRFKEELVQFILEDARKLFAIAAVVESNRDWLLQAMEFFRKHDRFRDKNLSAEVGEPPRCLVTDELIRMDSELWKRDKARKICEQQWVALAPVLSTEKANYDFDHRARLPFKTVSHVAMGGTFSIVHKVEIHRDHLKDPSNHFNSQWPTFFAVKEIKAPDLNERRRMISDWAKEAQTLKIINEQHRDHILRFVTAFTRPNVGSEKSCYLIFEWADGGSLGSLFEQNPNPKLTPKLVQQASTQLLGLARALEVTHELAQIRHGDIKPDNILRFEPSAANIIGTLKIGDWGLAKFHKEPTVLRLQKGQQTETRYGTVMYEPPEVELGELRLLSRQYDIWSMGCVVLEIIIWLVYGYRSVQRFRWDVQGRYRVSVPCYVIESSPDGQASKAKLQPIVERWLGYLAADPVCAEDTALGELIKLVRTRLLIVELPPFMGETVRIKEWEVEDVSGESGRRLAISPQTARGGNLEPANPGLGRHRATSTDLVTALEQIMGDEDRAGDYWLADEPVRQPAPDFDLTDNPLNANPRVFGDA
ncbi:hypothetical protein QBC47DRAFT_151925 [Echria macrotheca]|uniref:Protein kinase domain-containing protein n=1 Tax=Echria macrotheca TaxID=438768 RepID=A0AAJ0F3H3_9PEZI|nr:hypothetical protein QBC47DRAFT_151925 [Echria macrotheca]